MFDIKNIPEIIDHLQLISKIYKNIKNNEIQIHCPFCDDALRKNANHHGHLYISTTDKVFYCFRCDSSGTLLKLLIYTNFNNLEILELLSKTIKYNFTKDHYKFKIKNKLNPKETIKKEILNFIKLNPKEFKTFQNYIFQRIGENIDFTKFLISPILINKDLCCNFYNYDNEIVNTRFLFNNKIRYKLNEKSNMTYYFQEKNFEKYKRIVFTEGPFDIINLFLYNYLFKDCIFFSLSGKKYLSSIEQFIMKDLLIGEYEINLIFDNDDKKYDFVLHKCKLLAKNLNNNINIKGYLPLLKEKNDVGDYPAVFEV